MGTSLLGSRALPEDHHGATGVAYRGGGVAYERCTLVLGAVWALRDLSSSFSSSSLLLSSLDLSDTTIYEDLNMGTSLICSRALPADHRGATGVAYLKPQVDSERHL